MKVLGVRRKIVQTWLVIGGFFSALEPISLVAMVVHAVYDSGVHAFKNSNHPALAWVIAHDFGNFFGSYATINIAFFYLAIQHWRGNIWMSAGIVNAWRWKWALALLNIGVVGMTVALLIAGYEQSFIERAVEGSTWGGYFTAQNHPDFQSAMVWRLIFGLVTAAGLGLLIWYLLTIGKGETRKAVAIENASEGS